MLGAFVVALSQLTGQRDFGVGVPVSKRGSRWLADAVVCLVDTVCVRARVAAGSGFDEQHPMVRRALRDATGAQDLPFLDVVRALRVPSRHRTPLYQTLFVLQDPPPTLELPGCHTTPFQFDDAAVECDLVTEVWSTLDGGAEIRTSFRTNLVSADLAAAVDAALVHCLEAADAS
jgi:non-ribosomal peptide synthetase component F